jgi:DNA-binding beta-propeller fold protein YncE
VRRGWPSGRGARPIGAWQAWGAGCTVLASVESRMTRLACAAVLLASVASFAGSPAQSAEVVLVAASGGRDVLLFDGASLQRLATLPVGRGPHEIVVSADGRQAFVADAGSPTEAGTTISVLDLAAGAVAKTLSLPQGCHPHDLRVSRDGSRLWSTCAPAPQVVELDVRSGVVTRTWETGKEGGWMLLATPDEQKLYVANLEGRSLSAIDRRTNAVRTIALDGGAMGMDVSPDGRELWVGGVDAARVWVVDTASDRVVSSSGMTFERPGRIRFLPGGRQVLVQHARNRLSVVDASSRRTERSMELAEPGKCLAVSRDGRRAFVGHPGADLVTVVDLESMKTVGRFSAGPTPDGVALATR